ncbi:MAG: biotin transporter BioY [Halobacteriaceae archaeon]
MSVETDSVDLVGDEVTGNVARAVLFAAVTSATAPMSITHPLAPQVPITLQTLWVYLSGVVLGPLWAGVAFVLYLTAGAVGLPVFEDGGGLAYFLGPTGGYLVGFVFGAIAVGLVAHGGFDLTDPTDISVARLAAAVVAGSAVVWGLGGVWLMVANGMTLVAVLTLTSTFLLTGAVKGTATVAIAKSDALVAR